MALKAGRVGVRPDQVDAQGYIIGSGGGGGGGGSEFVRTLLANTISDNVVTLSESFKNYDFILLVGKLNYQGVDYFISSMYDTEIINAGDAIGVWTEAANLNIQISSVTSFAKTGGSLAFVSVYGYKFKEVENV